jgi:hypothetical protein
MNPCLRAALGHAFAVALYALTGHPQHAELAMVRLMTHIALHGGTGGIGVWS